jgi:Tol biopolymer transport system component
MPENHSARSRLDSWKEIADYLKRDVRTAIRWEKERRLPVHRVPGGKRQVVFAYPVEIDQWLSSLSRNIPEHVEVGTNADSVSDQQDPEKVSAPDKGADAGGGVGSIDPDAYLSLRNQATQGELHHGLESSVPASRWRVTRRNLALAGTVVLALGLTAALAFTHPRAAVTVRPVSLHPVTNDGHPKTNARTDGETLYFIQTEGLRGVLMSAPISGSPIRRIDTPFPNVAIQDLSRDGKTLLISASEGIVSDGQLWTISVQGGTPHPVGDAVCYAARWSPDERKLACAGMTTIKIMDADGSHAHVIASFSRPASQLLWSPDGAHLRFTVLDETSYTSTVWEIELRPDGTTSQPHKLPIGPGLCADWTWTRDGKTFVYIEFDSNSQSHLMIQPQKADRATELPLIGTVWSVNPGKEGDTLYLGIGNSAHNQLLKFDGKTGVFQTYLPELSGNFLAFSKDGKWMTYSDVTTESLWRSRRDGSEALQLVKMPMHVELSSWSPDGRRIAFMGRKPGKEWRIYLIGRDGGAMQEAADGDDGQGAPTWSPDGKELVYGNVDCEKTQNCWIRRIDLATRKERIVSGSNGLRTARWSPDGKYIAALRFQTCELMLYDVARDRWRVLADSVNGDNISWSSDAQYVYADSPRSAMPVIERVRIKDGQRSVAVNLSFLQKGIGQSDSWFGLAPDNSPILSHMLTTSEIYQLKWTDR